MYCHHCSVKIECEVGGWHDFALLPNDKNIILLLQQTIVKGWLTMHLSQLSYIRNTVHWQTPYFPVFDQVKVQTCSFSALMPEKQEKIFFIFFYFFSAVSYRQWAIHLCQNVHLFKLISSVALQEAFLDKGHARSLDRSILEQHVGIQTRDGRNQFKNSYVLHKLCFYAVLMRGNALYI